MPYTDLKCRILEEELQTFWPDWHVVRQISEGSFADVFEIRRNEFGVEFASALKVIRHRDKEIELQTAEILDSFQDSFEKAFADSGRSGTGHKLFSHDSVKNNDAEKLQNHADDDSMPELFRNEIRILEQLRGAPNVVNMEDLYYRKDGREHVLYIRMELLTCIKDLLQADRAFSVQEIIRIGKDICAALTCCEDRHIIHCDIKPGNLFLDKYGTCKVGDFGVSREMDSGCTEHTNTETGTISYMAPEVFQKRAYNHTVDIYALGLVLYQLLNRGRMPFMPSFPDPYTAEDIDNADYIRLHGAEVPSLLESQGNILQKTNAVGLDNIIRKACACQPQDRYQTAKEMEQALENLEITHPVNKPEQKRKQKRKKDLSLTAQNEPKQPVNESSGKELEKERTQTKSLPLNRAALIVSMMVLGLIIYSLNYFVNTSNERNAAGKTGVVKEERKLTLIRELPVSSYTWEDVIEAGRNGSYKEKFEIGYRMPLYLGEEGIVTMVLVAKDADELADGSGKAHMTWISTDGLKNQRRMNPVYEKGKAGTGTLGGWGRSEMRAYLVENVQSLLPEELQAALKQVKKISSTYNEDLHLFADLETVDTIWIPSVREVFGIDASWGEDKGPTYSPFFTNEKLRKDWMAAPSGASWWWLRSAGNSNIFYSVINDGYKGSSDGSSNADSKGGVCFGFCL